MGGQKTIGVIHNEAFEFLKKNYKAMWVISLILYAVQMILGIILSVFIVPLQIFSTMLTPLFAAFAGNGSTTEVMAAIVPMIAIIVVVSCLVSIVSVAVSIGQYASYIGGYDGTLQLLGGGKPTFDNVSKAFRQNWKRFVGVSAWAMLWEFLWSLLFVIPGIYKSYSYKLAPLLVLQYPEMTVRQALRKSMEISNGYKGRLFGLDVILFLYTLASIFGVCLLVIGSVVIQVLWLTPMMLLLYCIAYKDIKQAAIDKGMLQLDVQPKV